MASDADSYSTNELMCDIICKTAEFAHELSKMVCEKTGRPFNPEYLQVKKEKKKDKTPRDPNMPKRPLTPYLEFVAEQRKKAKDEGRAIEVEEIGRLWNALPDNKKQPYQNRYLKRKGDYDVALKQYMQMLQSGAIDGAAAAVSKRKARITDESASRVAGALKLVNATVDGASSSSSKAAASKAQAHAQEEKRGRKRKSEEAAAEEEEENKKPKTKKAAKGAAPSSTSAAKSSSVGAVKTQRIKKPKIEPGFEYNVTKKTK